MRFTLSSSALSSRLSILSKVINSKNALPILDCFLFEVVNNTLTITASDSENVMKTSMPLDDSDGEGKFAVNNRTILDAVKELPEQPLTIDVDTQSYVIKVIYQNGLYNFTGQNAEEYPLAQQDVSPLGEDWVFDGQVSSYVGIGRFALGLADCITVETPALREWMKAFATKHIIRHEEE